MKDDIFRQIIDIISGYDCKWWLDAGTCLAAVRKGDFIASTDDVDIGIHGDFDFLWECMITNFTKVGFDYSKGRIYKGYRVTLGFLGPEKLDIFFYYEKDNYLWHPICGRESEKSTHKIYKLEKFSKHLFSNLREVMFKDRLCYLPSPPEQYLIERYGENWKEPNPNYKFWRDSNAIDMSFKV